MMQDIALSGYFPVNNFSSLFTVFPHEEVKKKSDYHGTGDDKLRTNDLN